MRRRLILGVSGASGVILSYYLAKALQVQDTELHMIISDAAELTWDLEACRPLADLTDLADELAELCARATGYGGADRQRLLPDNGDDCCSLQYEDPGGDRHRLCGQSAAGGGCLLEGRA